MLITAALICALLQQPAEPRKAWDAWRSTIAEPSTPAWEESQTWRVEADGTSMEGSLAVRISAQGACLMVMRRAAVPAPTALEVVELGLLLEEDDARFWAELQGSDGTTVKHGMRASRESIDRTYVGFQEEMLRLATERADDGDATWLVHVKRCFPDGLANFLQPSRRVHHLAALTEALHFERRETEIFVRLKPRLDDGPLALLAETLDGFGAVENADPAAAPRGIWWTALDSARVELVLDPVTGALRSADLRLAAPASLFGGTAEPPTFVVASIRVHRDAPDAERLPLGPPEGLAWQDLEPHLELLRSFLEPPESIPLLEPILPPPPPY